MSLDNLPLKVYLIFAKAFSQNIPGVPKKTLHNFKHEQINVGSRYLKNIFTVQKTIT